MAVPTTQELEEWFRRLHPDAGEPLGSQVA